MMKMTKTQTEVVRQMVEAGADLVRIPGGFWTTRGAVLNGRGAPEWSVQVQTVRAMERAGVLVRANEFPEEWRDTRKMAFVHDATQGPFAIVCSVCEAEDSYIEAAVLEDPAVADGTVPAVLSCILESIETHKCNGEFSREIANEEARRE
jgi:hypothetical protein